MKTIYKESLAALVAATLALGCGSDQQQAKEPTSSMQTMSTQTTSATEVAPTPPAPQQPTPQQPATGGGGPQDTTTPSSGSRNAEPSSTADTMPATMDTNVTTLSDGEVFAIESSINKGEITLAELAKKKAANGEVKTFAGMMLTQHRDAQNKAKAIAAKEKITAQEGDATKKLEADVSATSGDLKDRKGHDFDTSYIDSQVRMHREVGALIDSQLLPSVKNAALKDQLTTFRQTISTHLTKAQEIQSHLEVVGAASTGTTGSEKAKGGATKGTTAPKPKETPAPKPTPNP